MNHPGTWRIAARRAAVIALFTVVMTAVQAKEESRETLMTEGRALTQAFFEGQHDALWDRFSDAMRTALGAPEALETFRSQLEQQLGAEVEVLDEELGRQGTIGVYRRIGRWDRAPMPIAVTWALGDDGRIEGFHVGPAQGWEPSAAAENTERRAEGFPDDETVLALLRQFVDERSMAPGVIVALVDPAGVRFISHGDAGDGVAPDAATVFEAGSISKVLTGMLLAEMAVAGNLRLDQAISELMPPDFAPPPSVAGITLEDLATHRAGVPRIGPGPEMQARLQGDQPYAGSSLDELLDDLLHMDPAAVSSAHGRYAYSNYGAALLGQLLARAAGETYETLVKERVLAPLGVSPAQFDPDAVAGRRAIGSQAGKVVPAWHTDAYAPAAGWQASAEMLVLLAEALMRESPPWLEESWRPRTVPGAPGGVVGLGWHRASVGGHEMLWHNGATFGSSSYLAVIPERRLALVLLANAGGGVLDDLAHALLPG